MKVTTVHPADHWETSKETPCSEYVIKFCFGVYTIIGHSIIAELDGILYQTTSRWKAIAMFNELTKLD